MNTQPINSTRERPGAGSSGGLWLLIVLVFLAGAGVAIALRLIPPAIVMGVLTLLAVSGFYTVQPNQAVAITVFGNYKGSDRTTGLRWVPFWYTRKNVSLRVRNVTSEALKVNDQRGNPIEIAANVVWHVSDSAQALFDVDDYNVFVNIQIETALRETARQYAYDHAEDGAPTLRDDADIVGARLKADLQLRVEVAGVTVDEAHLMHLAYAPEIAGAMLKRQQAEAVIAARQKIVAGAVGMVEMALEQLSERGVVKLDEERKAAMVSNLLVVLCADREAQPVVNTGTLYG
ncbi:SPFH domain-containing protein [Asticcacaulis sp. YBE204]|uniref:SPFH domain-containing protein n=1 Tax=Asticcacaulis sp. YBE204 TaxID=1282363 RepID=UPI0003C40052|nr:SPFH domain-containing protein [Asticcacaulis sp. YBE204]ESQ77842.1 membrane protein [Asticcacaulis sp. YBE204]